MPDTSTLDRTAKTTIDLTHLKRLLYEQARDRILKGYGITETPRDAEHFSRLLLSSLNQQVKPVKRGVTNDEVFEAAVKSIGSNSRDWSVFIAREPQLRELLCGYRPDALTEREEDMMLSELRSYFPGTSCSNDCRAVIAWIRKLNRVPEYYRSVILRVVEGFERLNGAEMPDDKLIICVSGFLSNPSDKWKGFEAMDGFPLELGVDVLKLNGMGYPLASEFLRNLGWNGFKPDRHIKRLLRYWYRDDPILDPHEILRYADLIGSRNKDLLENIRFSLLGQAVSPDGVKYSEVDNFLWALGAYVMKKGKEGPLRA